MAVSPDEGQSSMRPPSTKGSTPVRDASVSESREATDWATLSACRVAYRDRVAPDLLSFWGNGTMVGVLMVSGHTALTRMLRRAY